MNVLEHTPTYLPERCRCGELTGAVANLNTSTPVLVIVDQRQARAHDAWCHVKKAEDHEGDNTTG